MNNDIYCRFLQSTVGGLHATQPPTIRISAIRAVYSYCQHLKSANTTQHLIPFLPNILDGLLSIATQFSSDVLSLCLETMSLLLTVSTDCYFTRAKSPHVMFTCNVIFR